MNFYSENSTLYFKERWWYKHLSLYCIYVSSRHREAKIRDQPENYIYEVYIKVVSNG